MGVDCTKLRDFARAFAIGNACTQHDEQTTLQPDRAPGMKSAGAAGAHSNSLRSGVTLVLLQRRLRADEKAAWSGSVQFRPRPCPLSPTAEPLPCPLSTTAEAATDS